MISSCPSAGPQTMGPRAPSAPVSGPPVRGVPQYKYAAGVRNPQHHMNSQPQVTMQQVYPPLSYQIENNRSCAIYQTLLSKVT